MHIEREPVIYEWTGPFPTREVPTEVLYDIEVRFRHDANGDAARHVASALAPLGGDLRVRRLPLLGTRLRLRGGKTDLDARLEGGTAHVRILHRLKGRGTGRVVEALAAVPGARDLRIEATTPHFEEAYSDRGPCTPCAARRFPGRR